MDTGKVTYAQANGKGLLLEEFDHYIAVDWSQETMAIGHLHRRDRVPVVFERSSNIKELRAYLATLRGRRILTIEETTTAQWLYLELRDAVERIIICNPYRNRLLSNGPKTDKIDASKLCLLLRSGLLTEVFHSADTLYELRCVVSAYTDVVRAGVRAINQRSALVRGHSDTGVDASFIMDHLDKTIALYRETKEQYEAKFQAFCRKNRMLKALKTAPGIGTIGAVEILATVVDVRRFQRRGHYLSYCGLVKHQKYSGGRYYGRRKGQYNHTLKAVYKIAAMAALKGNNPIHKYYDILLSHGVADYNARNTVARYIARITYGILKTGMPYKPFRERTNSTPHKVA